MAGTVNQPSADTLELLFSNDESYELVDGVLCPKPMGSLFHGMMISWLCHLLEMQIAGRSCSGDGHT
jgi:hypothetical protein